MALVMGCSWIWSWILGIEGGVVGCGGGVEEELGEDGKGCRRRVAVRGFSVVLWAFEFVHAWGLWRIFCELRPERAISPQELSCVLAQLRYRALSPKRMSCERISISWPGTRSILLLGGRSARVSKAE